METKTKNTFVCKICKREFDEESEDWGKMCFRCSNIYHDAVIEMQEVQYD